MGRRSPWRGRPVATTGSRAASRICLRAGCITQVVLRLPGCQEGAIRGPEPRAPTLQVLWPGLPMRISTSWEDACSIEWWQVSGRQFDSANGAASPSGSDARDQRLVSRILDRKLTCLSDRKLASLITTCRSIESDNFQGIFLEAACALGGSAIMLASTGSRRPDDFKIAHAFGREAKSP